MSDSKEIEVVLLLADLSGYTALTQAHGDRSAAKIVTRYFEIVHQVLHPDARLVERIGDEVLISSPDALSVLYTAIGLRDAIEREPFFPTVHIGIHGGTVLEQDGHYFGTTLNLASRIAAHAHGGQILCTDRVAAMVDLEDVEYWPLGFVRFKNITDPVALFEVVVGGHKGKVKIIDPVCHMQVVAETAPAQLPFGGKTYYFCSFECAKAFANRPDHYMGS
jgi:class 3 adenylate cyclase